MQNFRHSKMGRTSNAISGLLVPIILVIIIVVAGGMYYAYSTRLSSVSRLGTDQAGFGTTIVINPGAQTGEFAFSLENVGTNAIKGISVSISTGSGQIASIKWSGDLTTNKTVVMTENDTSVSATIGTATGTASITSASVSADSPYSYTVSLTFSDGTTQTYSGSGTVSS
ncbi:MAG: hypothetical protein JRN26_06860 [Nitrososphaerota archaeon]|nr:hypothetical protein [Nitrososphaerota archaeon]MDG6936581.1 hypothetical protein [Nitrososphaerota archaeon]MDG6943574.1 hypothetical protein [Nitrososphaerota archaeon]